MKSHRWTSTQVQSASISNFGKKYIVEPYFLKLFGAVKNKKILELGSGNGYWLELLSKKGAICTGIEIADKQIQVARNKNTAKKIRYIQGDITNLKRLSLKPNTYDVVFLEHVLLEIPTRRALEKIFEGAFSVLKRGAVLLMSDIHPFAPSAKPISIRTGKDYHYFSSGKIFQSISKRIDGKVTLYKDFHWTLEDIIHSMTRSGLQVTEITEPRPTTKLAKKHPQLAYRLTRPMNIMIKAIKP